MNRTIALFAQADWLDGPRVRRFAWIFAVIALAALAGDFWLHSRAGLTDAGGEQLGRDFVNYWSGAHLAAGGDAARAYDIPGFVTYERSQTAAQAYFKWYSYPPTALVLSLPLAALGFVPALIAWLVSGVLACAALLARSLDRRMALLAAFATPASLVNALWGQNGQFTAALLCGGILFLERRPWLAGLFFGMLCFKPHLAILVPVALAAGGYWRGFIAAGVTALALCAAVFLLGPDVWAAFLHNAPINAGVLEVGDSMWHRMPTLFAATRLAGGGIAIAYGLQALCALAATLLTIRIWRSGAPVLVKGAGLVIATFLVTPYAWDYDLIALTFAAAWLVAEAVRTGFRPWEKIAIASAVAMPLIFSPLAAASHIQIGPLMLWLLLLLVAHRALQPDHQS
jgi:hypothetical protein